jgi:hypothetical protein
VNYLSEFDQIIFLRLGKTLTENYETKNLKEENEKIKKEIDENNKAIQILEKKIKDFEEVKKEKSFLSRFFNSKKDLLNETLEIERYYYNKCLLEKLQNPLYPLYPLLKKVEQNKPTNPLLKKVEQNKPTNPLF